jgi:hypothetical protein
MGTPPNQVEMPPAEPGGAPTPAPDPRRPAFQFTLLQIAKLILICAFVFGVSVDVYKKPGHFDTTVAVLLVALGFLSHTVLPGPIRNKLIVGFPCLFMLACALALLGMTCIGLFQAWNSSGLPSSMWLERILSLLIPSMLIWYAVMLGLSVIIQRNRGGAAGWPGGDNDAFVKPPDPQEKHPR